MFEGEGQVSVCVEVTGGSLPESVQVELSSYGSEDANSAQGQQPFYLI